MPVGCRFIGRRDIDRQIVPEMGRDDLKADRNAVAGKPARYGNGGDSQKGRRCGVERHVEAGRALNLLYRGISLKEGGFLRSAFLIYQGMNL